MKQKLLFSLFMLLTAATAWAEKISTNHIDADGSEYTIKTAEGWGVFCDMLASGESFSGKVVKLSDTWDNSTSAVTATVGTESHPFQGTFDGNGKTLNVNINDASGIQGTAPFRNIAGATIKNLNVVGSVTGSTHSAGLVGLTSSGNNTIVNCIVSADVSITNNYIGNFVGGIVGFACDATLNMTGCVFNGSLSLVRPGYYDTNFYYAGGLIGWCGVDGHGNPNTAPTLNITNCFSTGKYYNYAANHFHPIIVKWDGITVNSENITNNFYTGNPTVTAYRYSNHYVDAGTKAFSVTPNVPLDYGKATIYNVSGITAYANGIEYDGKYYTGSGTDVSFGAHAGYTLSDVTYNDGNGAQTLTADVSGLYSFTMPSNDVTITATRTPCETLALTANLADGNYWTTFYCGDAGYKIDDGENAWAYTATLSGDELTLHKLGKVIPAGTAVILVGEDNNISMTASTDPAEYDVSNHLRGVDVCTATADIKATLGSGTFYVLSKKGDDFGFFEYTADYMPARKAYLLVEGGVEQVKSLTMAFDGSDDATSNDHSPLTIDHLAGAWYDLNGRKLSDRPTQGGTQLPKGIYIVNGKKILK